MTKAEIDEYVADLRIQMDMAVKELDFEKAIEFRDEINKITKNNSKNLKKQ